MQMNGSANQKAVVLTVQSGRTKGSTTWWPCTTQRRSSSSTTTRGTRVSRSSGKRRLGLQQMQPERSEKLIQAVVLNPIFHGPGHMWPGFFECLKLKNLLNKKILKFFYSYSSVFSIFSLQDFPPTMMPFWLILQKVQKIWKSRSYETGAVEILPP